MLEPSNEFFLFTIQQQIQYSLHEPSMPKDACQCTRIPHALDQKQNRPFIHRPICTFPFDDELLEQGVRESMKASLDGGCR